MLYWGSVVTRYAPPISVRYDKMKRAKKGKIFCCAVIILSAFLAISHYFYLVQPKQNTLKWKFTTTNECQYIGVQQDNFIYIDKTDNYLFAITSDGELVYKKDAPISAFVINNILYCKYNSTVLHFDPHGTLLSPKDFKKDINFLDSFPTSLSAALDRSNGMWGYVNEDGRWVVSPIFTYAGEFSDGKAFVKNEIYQDGLIDQDGTFEPLCIYGNAYNRVFHNKRLLLETRIREEIFYTYITIDNKILKSSYEAPIIENYPYKGARDFSDDCAAVKLENTWGFINTDGNIMISPQYKNAFSFHNGVAVVINWDDSFGLIDKKGNKIDDFIYCEGYEATGEYEAGIYSVSNHSGGKNLINHEGILLLPQDYSDVYLDESHSIWILSKYKRSPMTYLEGIYCFFPSENNIVAGTISQIYEDVVLLDSSMNCFLCDRRTGAILSNFLDVREFHDGIAVASALHKGGLGYIDTNGQWIVQPFLKTAGPVHSNSAFVQTSDGISGIIDFT